MTKVRFWNPETDFTVEVEMDHVPQPGEWVVLGVGVQRVKDRTWYPTRQDEDGDPVDIDVEVTLRAV